MPDIATSADLLSRILASSHIALGLVSIFYPGKGPHLHQLLLCSHLTLTHIGAVNYGLPSHHHSNNLPEVSVLAPAIGGRQIGVGISMLVFSFAVDRHAVGVLAACSMLTKAVDVGTCFFRYPGADWMRHLIGMMVDGALAWALL